MASKEEAATSKQPLPPFHSWETSKVTSELNTNPETGLSSAEVAARQEKYGPNELEHEEEETIWDKIMEQFEDRFVKLLLLAAVISFCVSLLGGADTDDLPAWVEPSVIIAILIANGFIGIYQDYNSEKATQALKKLQSTQSIVLRDGKWESICSTEIVPGDIVKLVTGSIVPADCRMLKLNSLSFMVNQAPLTGENKEINKFVEACTASDIQGKTNMTFSGTLVHCGSAEVVVTSTAMDTEIGKIQDLVMEGKKDQKEEKTPLGEKLDGFGQFLEDAIFYTCIIIWVVNIKNFWDPMLGGPIKGALYYFKIAIALAVAAIPEGLPAVITTCLALGTRRMTANKAIVKKLPSVETLGCTTVICSDKTGTLTWNRMVASTFVLFGSGPGDFLRAEVECDSYEPAGQVTSSDIAADQPNLATLRDALLFNTTCRLGKKDGVTSPIGTPTEGALLALGAKLATFASGGKIAGADALKKAEESFTLANINSFDAKRKMMSVLGRRPEDASNVLFVKGAPERVLDASTAVLLKDGSTAALDNSKKDGIDAKIRALSSLGLRVLAVAYKKDTGVLADFKGRSQKDHAGFALLANPENYAQVEKELTFVGLVGIQDPLRPEVPGAISACSRAGICVFMVTGDNRNTAIAIGKQAGIVTAENAEKNTLIGVQLEKELAERPQTFERRLQKVIARGEGMIFARTAPEHKMRLVEALKKVDNVVAMTGDGVNDAPALVKAHIGVAMGIAGTEVAKESSEMILMDDNFATIVKAVEEGRGIYENMKAFIRYMISSNVGEVISIFLSSVMGLPDGFNSIQLLWVNLVTDGIPAMALSFNPPDADIMVKPPRSNKDGIVDSWVLVRYFAIGIYIGVATVGIFAYWYMFYDWAGDGHSLVEFGLLRSWTSCPNWEGFAVSNFADFDFSSNPCSYFTVGKAKASTLSLSVLVMIEMFNAFNAISENQSLLVTGIMVNPYLVVGVISSVLLHCVILYIPSLNFLFSTMPLDCKDWFLVIVFSFPVIIIDEILKVFSREKLAKEIEARKAEQEKLKNQD